MMLTDQKGFAALEAVLIVIIVAVLGFTSWFVWHAKRNADTSLNNSSQQATATLQKYLDVSNFGIKVPLSDSFIDIFQVSTTAGTKSDTNAVGQVEFSSNDVFHAHNSVMFCGSATDSHQELVIIDRDDSEAPVGTTPVETMTVGGHTYSVIPVTTPENNTCSTPEAKTLFTAKYQALLTGLKNAVAQ